MALQNTLESTQTMVESRDTWLIGPLSNIMHCIQAQWVWSHEATIMHKFTVDLSCWSGYGSGTDIWGNDLEQTPPLLGVQAARQGWRVCSAGGTGCSAGGAGCSAGGCGLRCGRCVQLMSMVMPISSRLRRGVCNTKPLLCRICRSSRGLHTNLLD